MNSLTEPARLSGEVRLVLWSPLARVLVPAQVHPLVRDRLRTAWRRGQTEECRAWDGWR